MKQESLQLVGLSISDAQRYVLGGHALFTVQNVNTGTRFTFKVRVNEQKNTFFVKVLTGSDNTADYAYLGHVFADKKQVFHHGRKSRIGADAPSAVYAAWLFRHLYAEQPNLRNAVIFHHGTCGCCGRTLTDPESILRGIGPVCMQRH